MTRPAHHLVMGNLPTYHGGPEVKLPKSDRSARNRGLKQTNPTPAMRSRVIVRNGIPIVRKGLSRIIQEIMASRAKLDAQLALSPKFRNQAQRPERERLGSGGTLTNVNRAYQQDPGAGEPDHADERALSRAIGGRT